MVKVKRIKINITEHSVYYLRLLVTRVKKSYLIFTSRIVSKKEQSKQQMKLSCLSKMYTVQTENFLCFCCLFLIWRYIFTSRIDIGEIVGRLIIVRNVGMCYYCCGYYIRDYILLGVVETGLCGLWVSEYAEILVWK